MVQSTVRANVSLTILMLDSHFNTNSQYIENMAKYYLLEKDGELIDTFSAWES